MLVILITIGCLLLSVAVTCITFDLIADIFSKSNVDLFDIGVAILLGTLCLMVCGLSISLFFI